MAVITLRQSNVVTSNGAIIKNSFVSPQEVDNNFSNINIELGSLSNSIVSTSVSLTQQLNNTNSFLTSFVTTNLNATSNNLISIVSSNVVSLTNYVNDTANSLTSYTNNSIASVNSSLNSLSNSTTFSFANILSNNLLQFAPTSSEQLRELITDETGFGNLVYSNSPTIFNSSIENSTLKSSTERANIVNDIAPVEITYNLADQTILYYTSNSTSNVTINFTGNSTTSLDSYLNNNSNTVSAVVLLTNGAVPKYIQNVKVDGVVVANATIKGNLYWLGNAISIPGNSVSIDLYSFTIIKTLSNTFTILAAQSQYKSFL